MIKRQPKIGDLCKFKLNRGSFGTPDHNVIIDFTKDDIILILDVITADDLNDKNFLILSKNGVVRMREMYMSCDLDE